MKNIKDMKTFPKRNTVTHCLNTFKCYVIWEHVKKLKHLSPN